jgi:hypothetical protein
MEDDLGWNYSPHSKKDSDLFVKMKEPLRGTRYNTREQIVRSVRQSLLDLNRSDALMVYNAFYKFGRLWCRWGGG